MKSLIYIFLIIGSMVSPTRAAESGWPTSLIASLTQLCQKEGVDQKAVDQFTRSLEEHLTRYASAGISNESQEWITDSLLWFVGHSFDKEMGGSTSHAFATILEVAASRHAKDMEQMRVEAQKTIPIVRDHFRTMALLFADQLGRAQSFSIRVGTIAPHGTDWFRDTSLGKQRERQKEPGAIAADEYVSAMLEDIKAAWLEATRMEEQSLSSFLVRKRELVSMEKWKASRHSANMRAISAASVWKEDVIHMDYWKLLKAFWDPKQESNAVDKTVEADWTTIDIVNDKRIWDGWRHELNVGALP